MALMYPKLIESKASANEVTHIEWNPKMDLLATIFKNGALTCSRLLSLQKVWHKQANGRMISMAWRPDGRVLAIGSFNQKTKENVCTLHDVEDGKRIHTITMQHEITSVNWFQYSDDHQKPGDGSKLLSSLKDGQSDGSPTNLNDTFSHQLAYEQKNLNILMIATEDGAIQFYSLGLFYLGEISIHSEKNSKILSTHLSNCLRYITAHVCTKQLLNTAHSLQIFKLDLFNKRSDEILRVSKMYAKIADEFEYLDDTINAITTSWEDVLAGLDNKLSSYCCRKRDPEESQSGYTFLSADELLQLLVIGHLSDNLEKFLADMSDKGLKKLNSAIEQTCSRVQNLIVRNAQKCCYHLHADLNLLRGMSLWRDRYEEVGLKDNFIVGAMQAVGSLMLKLTELQQVIDHSLKSTKSFFRWLISIACRMSGEQSNSVVPNEINKTTQQDIQLITDFIVENFDYNETDFDFSNVSTSSMRPTCSNFTLEQVGQYLKNEPLSRLKYSFSKPGTNFWVDFMKQRPDLTVPKVDNDGNTILLFYPHNENTSLIQEHKQTCKTIESAFASVTTNIKSVLESGEKLINLKDFIRAISNADNRIRIETNMKRMQHYTLFQLKCKQYLIIQSLIDKSFKLISIKFERKSNLPPLLISDSGFYEDKSTKKLLLSFLLVDETKNETVILQIELKKILDNYSCPDKLPRDIQKIFRSEDTLEKNSSHVILNLDLSTEPAQDRKFDHDMMVKKIIGVTGKDMFSSSGRGVIGFTSCNNKRLHLYEIESTIGGEVEISDDKVEGGERVDESLIDTDV